MDRYLQLLEAITPVALIILTGIFLRRKGLVKQESDSSLMCLLVNCIYPCFLFNLIFRNEALKNQEVLFSAPLCGFVTIALGIALAFLFAPLFGLKVGKGQRAFAVTVGIYNYGYIPFPIVLSIYDQETAGVLALFNLGVELCLWTVGVIVLSETPLRQAAKKILNAPSIAIVLAVTANFLVPESGQPEFVLGIERVGLRTIELLGGAAIPLGLLLAAFTFSDLLPELDPRRSWVVMTGACLLRLVLFPVIFLAGIWLLPLPVVVEKVLVVQAAMPAAVLPVVLTRHYGGHTATAIQVVIGTTICALPLIPLWIDAGLRLIGQAE